VARPEPKGNNFQQMLKALKKVKRSAMSNKIKVTCEVRNYDEPAKESLKVHSHWLRKEFIVLEIDDEKYTIVGDHLIAAIENCKNAEG